MKTKLVFTIILFLLIFNQARAQQDTIRSFDDLKERVTANSMTLKRADFRLTQAKKEKLVAIYGLIDPAGNLSGAYTNNTRLPVNLIPSEILGGQPGTFQEVRFGVQYVTNLNAYAELKLINLQGWENLQLSKINIQVNETDGRIGLKNLLENVAVVYYNILHLQEQHKAFRQNLLSADTLYSFTRNKYNNGLATIQDLNDSEVNRLNVAESIKQIDYQLSQQYVALKLLCDFPESEGIAIKQESLAYDQAAKTEIATNTLLAQNASEKLRLSKSNLKLAKYSIAPSLSVFGSLQDQQFNTRARLFDNNVSWSASNYIGVKLSIPIPGGQFFRQTTRARYDYLIAKTYAEQMNLQVSLNTKQLLLDREKTLSQLNSNFRIYNLRMETYRKNLLNYREGLIGIEQTINSFNAMIASHYSYISSVVNLLMVEEKININNKIN